ncbi:hypothetical protein VCHA53O466_40442 [Vibrio chagasii]|nr:hypothetical protein VCHA53O466_40442 [Vibrio chagasii]
MQFIVGQELYWLHGDTHRIATVLAVESERVKLSGLTADYWIKKATLIKKLDKPYPTAKYAN